MSEENEKQTTESSSDSSIYYILGGVVLVAAVAGFFLLKPKAKTVEPAPTAGTIEQPVAQPTPGPITKLACEKQYYNPKVGFTEYYLSVEGVDTLTTGEVVCEFTMSVNETVVGTATATSTITENAARGGGEFRCTSNAVPLAKGVATDVAVKLTDTESKTATCSQSFIFP